MQVTIYTSVDIREDSGLTRLEYQTAGFLANAWNDFVLTAQEGYSDDDIREFRDAIHACQRILMSHAFARLFKGYWK